MTTQTRTYSINLTVDYYNGEVLDEATLREILRAALDNGMENEGFSDDYEMDVTIN